MIYDGLKFGNVSTLSPNKLKNLNKFIQSELKKGEVK